MSRSVLEKSTWGRIGEQDLYLFGEGTHVGVYRFLGSHPGSRSRPDVLGGAPSWVADP